MLVSPEKDTAAHLKILHEHVVPGLVAPGSLMFVAEQTSEMPQQGRGSSAATADLKDAGAAAGQEQGCDGRS